MIIDPERVAKIIQETAEIDIAEGSRTCPKAGNYGKGAGRYRNRRRL